MEGNPPCSFAWVWTGRLRHWKRRYLVATTPGVLLIYLSATRNDRPMVINLNGVTIRAHAHARHLSITSSLGKVHLRTLDKSHRDAWVHALRESISRYTRVMEEAAGGVPQDPSHRLARASVVELKQAVAGRLPQGGVMDRDTRHVATLIQACVAGCAQRVAPAQATLVRAINRVPEALAALSAAVVSPIPLDAPAPGTPLEAAASASRAAPAGELDSISLRMLESSDQGDPQQPGESSGGAPQPGVGPRSDTSYSDAESTPRHAPPASGLPMRSDRFLSADSGSDMWAPANGADLSGSGRNRPPPVDSGSHRPEALQTAWAGYNAAVLEELRDLATRAIEAEFQIDALRDSGMQLRQHIADLEAQLLEAGSSGSPQSDSQPVSPACRGSVPSGLPESPNAATAANASVLQALEVLHRVEYAHKSGALVEHESSLAGVESFISIGDAGTGTSSVSGSDISDGESAIDHPVQARTRLPAPRPLDRGFSIWSVLKNAIGKDLSNITMPATINEPLSALQRLAEDMRNVPLLEAAAGCPSSARRLMLVSVFAVASYSSALLRDCKPFNPLLGETYEWRGPQGGARLVAEQVSHHPQVSVFHAEGGDPDRPFTLDGEFELKNRFWGSSVELQPLGFTYLKFGGTGDSFVYNKVNGSVNNLLMGKLWLDWYGTLQVDNWATGEKALIHLRKGKSGGRQRGRIDGTVLNAGGQVMYTLSGNYMDRIMAEASPLARAEAGGSPSAAAECVYENKPSPADAEEQYNFNSFTITLNELRDDQEATLCPTDSRLRTDQSALENGETALATSEKLRLEAKQRDVRHIMKRAEVPHRPMWFSQPANTPAKGPCVQTARSPDSLPAYQYRGRYWDACEKADWQAVPDLYSCQPAAPPPYLEVPPSVAE